MGVNVRCRLPGGIRLGNVAQVAAALLGHEKIHEPISGAPSSIFARVKGHSKKCCGDNLPECAYIVLDTRVDNPVAKSINKSDGDSYHLMYHFEGDHLGPLMLPACTGAKIALCVGLVDFFGGEVDFCDSDDSDVDYEVERRSDIHATDGEEWNHLNNRILAVEPITAEELYKYEEFAAY